MGLSWGKGRTTAISRGGEIRGKRMGTPLQGGGAGAVAAANRFGKTKFFEDFQESTIGLRNCFSNTS
jgi:hypothetical protein